MRLTSTDQEPLLRRTSRTLAQLSVVPLAGRRCRLEDVVLVVTQRSAKADCPAGAPRFVGAHFRALAQATELSLAASDDERPRHRTSSTGDLYAYGRAVCAIEYPDRRPLRSVRRFDGTLRRATTLPARSERGAARKACRATASRVLRQR